MVFKELRKDIYKNKLDIYKHGLVILKKLEIGHYLQNIDWFGDYVHLNFIEDIYHIKSSNCQYTDNFQNKIIFSFQKDVYDKNDVYKFEIYIKEKLIINNKFKGINDITFNEKEFTGHNKIRFMKYIDKEDNFDDRIKDTIQCLYFYENTKNNMYKYLSYLNFLCNDESPKVISLQRYNNLRKYNMLFEKDILEKPNSDMIDNVLNILKIVKNSAIALNNNEIQYKTNTYSINIINKTIIINLGGFTIFNTINLERWKYISHPGLELFTKILYTFDEIDKFELNLHKQIFKKV